MTITCEENEVLARLLKQRRAVRGFLPRAVPPEILARVFEMARFTPSNCNAQPWHAEVLSGAAANRMRKLLCDSILSGTPESPDFPITVGRPGEYRIRQINAAKALFSATGVQREDIQAREESYMRNYRFFDAPHVAFLFMPDWCSALEAADIGMFAQSLMLALTAHGLASCPQASLGQYADVVRHALGLPPEMRLLIGLSFGYEDSSHPANAVRTDRAEADQFVTFRDT